MVKAIVSGGEIRPIEPLPADWKEGQPLRVEKADDGEVSAADIDRDFADEERLDRALNEARRQAKEHVRRQMGLP